jgi:hypothetical protein
MDVQAGGNNMVFTVNKACLACPWSAKIDVINPVDMTRTTFIDISSYGVGDNSPDPALTWLRKSFC